MDGAKSPDQISTINSHHVALGKDVGEDVEGDAVIGVIKNRDEHNSICDVEICVAGGKAATFKLKGSGHREIDDGKRLA